MPDTQVPQLVPVTREQYLRREEPRLLAAGAIAAKTNPELNTHLEAATILEDIIDIHEAAANRYTRQQAHHIAAVHTRHAQGAQQIRLHHLDQIARIV
jgi:hypothetical protein